MVPLHLQLLALMALSLMSSYCSPPGDHNYISSPNKRSQSNVQRNALPSCGEKCMAKLLSDTAACHPADSWCLCHSGPWQVKVEQCFEANCSPVDMITSLLANEDFCNKLSQPPTKPPTKPLKSLPIHSNPQDQPNATITTGVTQASVAEEPRTNVTEPFHGVSFRNQTLAPHSPFESTSSAFFSNFHLICFHFGTLAAILNLAE